MSTTTKKEGSYSLAILSALGAATCMVVTALMVRELGQSLGATESGRQLLSSATVAVHLIGLVMMGLAFGYFDRQRDAKGKRLAPGWSAGTLIVMIMAGGFTMASIYGFVASQRMSKQAALERQIAEETADKKAAREAANKKLDAQIDMTKGLVDWAKKSVKTDDLGRRERKDMLEAAQKAITDVAKDTGAPAKQAPASKDVTMQPDAQAEGLAKVLNLPIDVVQNSLGLWLAALLIVLEMMLWPQTTRLWPRKIAVELIEAKPEQAMALTSGREAGIALTPAPEPKALPAPLPESREPAPKILGPESHLEPETVAIPHRLILLPGADRWLELMKYPILARKPGPLTEWSSYKASAGCFACWLQAHGLGGPYSHAQIVELWGRCCTDYHKEQIAWNVFRPEIDRLKGRPIESKKIRIDGQESPRPTRWYIADARRAIEKCNQTDPKKEAEPAGHRPLAVATSVSLTEAAAANDNRKKVVPAWIELQRLEAREQKWMATQNTMRSRKQRGSRVARMGRAA